LPDDNYDESVCWKDKNKKKLQRKKQKKIHLICLRIPRKEEEQEKAHPQGTGFDPMILSRFNPLFLAGK